MRRQLEETYDRLAYETGPSGLALTRDAYVTHFLSNYQATYQVRAASALGRIATPAARDVLDQAWIRVRSGQASYRGDVVAAITAALNRASQLRVGFTISPIAMTPARVGDTVVPVPRVVVRNADSTPARGIGVTFTTTSGRVRDPDQVTDSNGVARVGAWRLGVRPGLDTLLASVPGLPPVVHTATATARPGPFIFVLGGDNQRAHVDDTLSVGPTVLLTDGSGTPLGGQSVRFDVIGTATTKTVPTNSQGVARWGPWVMLPGVNRVNVSSPFMVPVFPSTSFTVATPL